MRRSLLLVVALPLTVSIAACSGAVTSAAPPTTTANSAAPTEAAGTPSSLPSAAPSTALSAEPSAASSADTGPTAAPTAIDPCQLVTQDEASALAGVTMGAGKPSTTDNRKSCTYGAAGTDLTVIVVQAPSQAALDAGKASVLADLQKAAANGLKTTRLTGIGDDAALLTVSHTGSGMTINAIGVYVLKGLTFFAITDVALGHAVADASSIEAQATTAAGRVP